MTASNPGKAGSIYRGEQTYRSNPRRFLAIQRKGLSICLGLPSTSGREAMEVEGNILPVDLRIEEIAVREIAKIQSKNIAEPVKQQCDAVMIYMNNKNHYLGRQ